jgi:hypothetical protein
MNQSDLMKIKLLFSASVILNFVLVVFLITSTIRSKTPRAEVPAQASVTKAVSIPATSMQEPPRSITWNKITSPEYANYISNLRALGCPERTIRWIIASEMSTGNQPGAADVASLTPLQQEQLQQFLGAPPVTDGKVPVSPAGGAADVSFDEQGVVTNSPLSQISTTNGNATNGAVTAEAAPAPQFPLAFYMQAGPRAELAPEQKNALQSLIKSFTDQVGGSNQNPTDPAYLTRWQDAQPISDGIFRAQFGYAAYGELVHQREMQAASKQ